MLENISLQDVSADKVKDLCARFTELSTQFDEDKIVDLVLDDFNFGYCLEEEIYIVFDYWKNNN